MTHYISLALFKKSSGLFVDAFDYPLLERMCKMCYTQ